MFRSFVRSFRWFEGRISKKVPLPFVVSNENKVLVNSIERKFEPNSKQRGARRARFTVRSATPHTFVNLYKCCMLYPLQGTEENGKLLLKKVSCFVYFGEFKVCNNSLARWREEMETSCTTVVNSFIQPRGVNV